MRISDWSSDVCSSDLIKITSITREIMQVALGQAREGRMHILGEMAKALTNAREGVSATAPKMTMMKIPTDKIREVIGSGGKVFCEIFSTTGANIYIDDDGSVKISAVEEVAPHAPFNFNHSVLAHPSVVLPTGSPAV